MTNEEKQFQQYVDSLRFDDAPSKTHQDKLESRLLEAYDHHQKYGDYVEPVSIYLRKLAAAAGFLIVCGILFWGIDRAFITNGSNFIANHPDKEILEQIIKEEQSTGVDQKNLLAQLRNIWKMIDNEDADALVSVLQTNNIARTVRSWAANYLGRFGDQETLAQLEQSIQDLDIQDLHDPLMTAAQTIRERLDRRDPNTSNH